MHVPLIGAAPLLRATVKYDARNSAPWIVIVTILSVSSVIAYPLIFPSTADRAGLALGIGANPAIGLIFGPAFDLSTTDGFNAWRALALGGFFTALGTIFAVTRATRAQEDSGQAELLASGVLSRHSRLFVGVAMGLITSLLTGIVAGVLTSLCGGSWHASMLLGATFTMTGWMFTAVAAVTAQIGADSRTANSLAVGALGSLFMLRGFAYSISAPEWTIWTNPLGWMTQTRPASGNHWAPLLAGLAFTLVVLGVAFTLHSRRDFGQGSIAARPGASRRVKQSTISLVIRLNRAPILTWTIALVCLGIVFGYFATSIHDILKSNNEVAHLLAAGATTSDQLISTFLVTVLSLIGIIAAVPGVQIMQKVRTEELDDRVDPVLASSVSRPRYFACNVGLALAVPSLYMLISGSIVAALAALAGNAGIGVASSDIIVQTIATVPAVWTVIAVAVAVIGAKPHVAIAAWAGALMSFGLTLLGPAFALWDSIMAISPFSHVPNVTAANPSAWGLVWVTIATVILLTIGFVGFRRRDLG